MEPIQLIFANNLKQLRLQRCLSLEQTPHLCGVSKSMLAQIERGATNPTISTIWKISNGLKIPFTDLMSRPQNDVDVVHLREMKPFLESGGSYRNYPLFDFTSDRHFEVLYIELDPGTSLQSEAHPQGTQEFLTVFSGEVKITIHEGTFSVADGSAIRFRADQVHTYENTSDTLCRISMIISYR